MKTLIISDSHNYHNDIEIPNGIDCIIHAGDCTNYHDLSMNEQEFNSFINWYSKLNIKHKILIAGNHDASLTQKYNVERVKKLGIKYLEHGYCEIENKLFFGSPYTPTFGNWYFMKSKEIIHKYWEQMEDGIDVLITHGPPFGILDLVDNFEFKQAGCPSLLNHVRRIKPKFHIFGHIHDNNDCLNHGIMIREDITFINASLVEDGKRFLKHKPIIIEI